jgi:ABC-type Mn2+/Zn2+ transport system permease subunit
MSWLFDPFRSEFMQNALMASLLVGLLSPVLGVWVTLRRLSYLGDAMSHATLGGVALGVTAGVSATFGGIIAGVIAGAAVALLGANERLGQDAIIGLVQTTMFAIGVIIISRTNSGLELSHYLFGQVTTVNDWELLRGTIFTVLALGAVVVLFRDLRIASFDPVHARQVGVPVGAVRMVLLVLLSIAIVVSLSTVGVLMSVAMLITPATAARMLTTRLIPMTFIAAAVGCVAAVGGLVVSYHFDAPPGASIALVASALCITIWLTRLPSRHHDHARANEPISTPSHAELAT